MYTAAVSGSEGPGRAPFRALLATALTHADAALGLACAYSELPPDERSQLLDAVLADASADALALSPLLGPLCALETDPALSARLRGLLEAHGVALRVSPPAAEPPRIFLLGDANAGAALLVRPAPSTGEAGRDERDARAARGGLVDALALSWDGARLSTERTRAPAGEVPVLAAALRERQRGARATLPEIEQVPLDLAAEVIAQALWRHLRAHGVLPVDLSDFADLIGPHDARAAIDPD